jgi:hypothetical protein
VSRQQFCVHGYVFVDPAFGYVWEMEADMGLGKLSDGNELQNKFMQDQYDEVHRQRMVQERGRRILEAESRRPMTEAEERLVERTVSWHRDGGVLPDLAVHADEIIRERTPKRPITAEEVAVIEAAKEWVGATCSDVGSGGRLIDAVRRLK